MNEQLLLSIIENINLVNGHYPGKKELQKTVYLLQKKGLGLKYAYRFYFYGPYSDALDEDVQRLAIQGILGIQQDEYTHRVTLSSRASNMLSTKGKERDLIYNTINDLRQISPAHLELMATIVFLFDNKMIPDNHSEAAVVKKVHDVKANKYGNDEIRKYFQFLKEKEYIQ